MQENAVWGAKKMNVRFSESSRESPLELMGPEIKVFNDSVTDGRTQRCMALTCQKDIFIGIFFDGTNNKYRDTPGFVCQETPYFQ